MVRSLAAAVPLFWRIEPSWIGPVLVVWSTQGVRAIVLADDEAILHAERRAAWPAAQAGEPDAVAARWLRAVAALIAQPPQQPSTADDLPLDVAGTAFQQSVWAALRHIPAGQTVSYGELARRLGRPRAVRAVAGACAANVLAVAIPCHRVVAADGGLAGYRWGLGRKQALLQREAAAARSAEGRAGVCNIRIQTGA